jgi:hypothetical protein
MRWKPDTTAPVAASEEGETTVAPRDRVSADLQSRGVAVPAAEVLAEAVAQELHAGSECYAAVLDGVALGFRVQTAIADELARSAGELQEIERLMGSFAGELSKLDEVLEVLAAYLRRMRSASPPTTSRVVH